MTPFWKTLTFWISACSWFVVLGGHYAGVIPSPYGLVLSNVVVLIYGLMRCLQKRQAGTPWKGILFTSEFVGTSATMVANLLDAAREIPSLPPKLLVGLAAASGLLVTILHQLSVSGTVGAGFPLPAVKRDLLAPQNLGGLITNGDPVVLCAERLSGDGLFPSGHKQTESGAPLQSQPEVVTEPVRPEDIVATTPDFINPKNPKNPKTKKE